MHVWLLTGSSCGDIVFAADRNGAILRRLPTRGEKIVEAFLIWLLIGAIAGWLAGQIVRGFGFGLIGNIVVGIVGAFIAGWLLPKLNVNIGGGYIAEIVNAVIGAVILLVVVGLVRRA
jgi:uncharacterized membrane protein YeaQ/YmgE (transglycosylase-associated protein family)